MFRNRDTSQTIPSDKDLDGGKAQREGEGIEEADGRGQAQGLRRGQKLGDPQFSYEAPTRLLQKVVIIKYSSFL
jgi:hypothetical protein